jgi:hypothetical protein
MTNLEHETKEASFRDVILAKLDQWPWAEHGFTAPYDGGEIS